MIIEFFLKRFFEVSRARWWQIVAATSIGAMICLLVVSEDTQMRKHAIAATAVGAGMGLLAAIFLLCVDAGRRGRAPRGREPRAKTRRTFRQKLSVVALAVSGLSLVHHVVGGAAELLNWIRVRIG